MYCQRCEQLCPEHAAEADRRQSEFDRRDEIARLTHLLGAPFPPLVVGADRPRVDELESRLIELKLTACERLLPLIARSK